MKHASLLFVLVFGCLVLMTGPASAQFVVGHFENAADSGYFLVAGTPFGAPGPTIATFNDTTQKVEGEKSLKAVWTIKSTETWGGFTELLYLIPKDTVRNPDSTYLDFSGAKYLSLWYYNEVPAHVSGKTNMRLTLHEGGSGNFWAVSDNREDWVCEIPAVFDSTGGWRQLKLPLIDKGRGTPEANGSGFWLPGWFGENPEDAKLDLDKIVGWSLIWTTPGLDNNGSDSGVVYFDKLELLDAKYDPIETFDNVAATEGYFGKDVMSWDGGNKGALTFTDITANPFQGASTLRVDYTVNPTQGWGGYVNFEHKFSTPLDLSGRSELILHFKNLVPDTLRDDSELRKGRTMLRFILYDDTEGSTESWFIPIAFDLTSATEWTMVRLPLDQLPYNSWELSPKGFTNPDGQGGKDRVFSTSRIGGYKFEFSANASGPNNTNVISTGAVLLDFLLQAGQRQSDKNPPAAPAAVAAVAGDFVNLVTWTDVPGEAKAKYSVYFSDSVITNVDAPGVEIVAAKIPAGTQVVQHSLRAPLSNQTVRYYYAVVCTDSVQNVGPAGSSSVAVANMAKGVPTISVNPPAAFTADGDISEWTGIPKFRMAKSDGSGSVVQNTQIDNDADLSADMYIAIDTTYLYVAFDVTDDVVESIRSRDSWLNDAPDLFIGLYNWHGPWHPGLQRGAEPDYHFRFGKNALRLDGGVRDSLMGQGANYAWVEKFPSGYIVEARIPLDSIAFARNPGGTNFDNRFHPREGMRIPIDIAINDNDNRAPNFTREGIMTYSPLNEDRSYQEVSRWSYTWIGGLWNPTGVGNTGLQTPFAYALQQNYPNPFNPTTVISYSLEKAGPVMLRVFDVLGRQVAQLVNEHQEAGTHTVSFNAASGGLSSGVYFYRIDAGSFHAVKKLMLVK